MEKEGFSDDEILFLLRGLLGKNDTSDGNSSNSTDDLLKDPLQSLDPNIPIGIKIYSYLTPLIICLGLVGNVFALVVYVMPQMRQLGICLQLAAVAVSDSVVLLVYVLPEWLAKGLPVLGGRAVDVIHVEGVCQSFLFLGYMSRAVSAWLLASFSVQQCLLLYGVGSIQRTQSQRFAGWMIGGTLVAAAIACIYKPILSGIHPQVGVCGSRPEHSEISFALDVTYGLSISILPSVIITVANVIILAMFLSRQNMLGNPENHFYGFTITIIVTTLAYVCLNFPYFIMWVRYYVMSDSIKYDLEKVAEHHFIQGHLLHHHTHLRSDIYLTRMLFYVNFAIKALLYGITAKRFRQQTRSLCKGQGQGQSEMNELGVITMETPGTIAK